MIHHLKLHVRDVERSRAFSTAALEPLGFRVMLETEPAVADASHGAALDAGGRDNGAPGPRRQYDPGCYGGFVLDSDGDDVEAMCHSAGAAR